MYTFLPPICIPTTLCGEPFPVSTQIERIQLFYSKVTVPLGLFLVAFPPPPVTFPATRLAACLPKKPHIERRCTHLVDHPKERYPFLSG